MAKPRVLLIGWDAADWKVIDPLLKAGQMPNLARLMAEGVHGNVATIYPVLSPMLWTSISTGKRAYKHGVQGFTEPLPDGSGVRPITLLSRKTKAIWNILNQTGRRSIVVGWWPSHPAEPLNGVMVSNYFQHPAGEPGAMTPLPAGTVHPAALSDSLAELRVHPMELNGEFIRLFVPEYERVDQARDKRLHSLGKIISETMSVHAAATELLGTHEWDFAAVYYSAIDHFGHGYMRYHPPKPAWVGEEDFSIYQHVIANAYRYHDAMLGALLNYTDQDTTVILMSDHGFHPDHLRPPYIPAEPAGPAIEHRHFGMLCLKGPTIRSNEKIFGAGLLDICPTILSLFGLPPGRDMDGKVLSTVFKEPPRIEPIASWDNIAGEAGVHAPEARLDPLASAQAFKQLVELGYVAPPGETVQETVEECVAELRYNLARAYRDGNCCGEAVELAEQLWARWPKEHRFGILLIESLGMLRQVGRRRQAIEELSHRIDRYQAEAKLGLEQKEKEQVAKPEVAPGFGGQTRKEFEERKSRELAMGRPLLMEWLFLSQALLEKNFGQARRHLDNLTRAEHKNHEINRRVAGALAQLGEEEEAQRLLERCLEVDMENPVVHAQLAEIHRKAGRWEAVIGAATESLSLLYFQPSVHGLLGQALMKSGRFAEAEQELKVAIAQSPRNLAAHEFMAELYREHLNRGTEAFAHEGRARSLQNELGLQLRTAAGETGARTREKLPLSEADPPEHASKSVPAAFGPEVQLDRVITVVSGLPRSGTSMMMQLLAAGGKTALTDGKRAADEDNPLGYLEFEKASDLARDTAWVREARGRVVKVVAQLLPFLPREEHYHLVFMQRNLDEVIASQQMMLARQGRQGASLGPGELMAAYRAQLQRVKEQLARRSEFRTLMVDYGELLADPVTGINRVAAFVGEPFDQAKAFLSVRPELQRQHQSSTTKHANA